MKTHCVHGHELTEDNVYRKPGFGWRQCKACNREAVEAYRKRKASSATLRMAETLGCEFVWRGN